MNLDPAEGVFVDFDEYATLPTAKQPSSTVAARGWSRLAAHLPVANPAT